MRDRHLFLFGGTPPFNKNLGKRFANLSLNEKGKVGIIFIEREGWREYMPKYTSVLEENGLKNFEYIPLSPSSTIGELETSTGIIICGGETELYRNLIVDTVVGKKIKEMYEKGIPVAGFSAGALITPEHCVIPPIDNSQNRTLFLKGLGLIHDCVVSVHYSTWNEEENLKRAIEVEKVSTGYGIDDNSGLYFHNEIFTEAEGNYFIFKRT